MRIGPTRHGCTALLVAMLAATGAAAPQDAGEPGAARGLALRAAKVLLCPLEGEQVLDHGVVLVRDGRIVGVGPAAELVVPEDYESLDLGAAWIVPGMIDLHCHVGGPSIFQTNDINDMVYLTNPGLRVSPAVIPGNRDLRLGLAGGVTSVLYIPGSGTNMGGQGVLLRTAPEHYEEAEIRNPGSLKLAQAGNPERFLFGVGRAFMNWNTRNTFLRGLAYARAWKRHEAGEGERPEVDLQFEIFRALESKLAQVSTHTQIYQVVLMTITMVRQELGLEVFIDHGTFDGWRAAALAEESGVPAILGPRGISVPSGRSIETDGQIHGVAAKYQEQGHRRIGFNTDSPIVPQHELSLQAAMGVRYGMDCSGLEHVRGLTVIPAFTAGLADRLGSVEPGREADLLVVTGDPVDPRSSVRQVFQRGRRVYDADRDRQLW
jgi:imidazolonepropionase-like amidohydrolase